MRILVVTNMYPSESRPSHGIFVRDQVEALRSVPDIEVEVWKFQTGALHYLAAALKLAKFIRGKNFDVVHAHYGLAGWPALVAGRKRLIVTFHGTDLRHRIVAPLSRLLARIVRVPAIASPKLRESVGKAVGRTVVLPTGVNLTRFRPEAAEAARARLGLDPGGRYLLFASDPERKVKRFDRAQELVQSLAGVKLLTLKDATPDEVPDWINASNAVLVTSDAEGFGLAVCEGLACNRPVFATPVGIAPLALNGVEGCLCAPFDSDRWAEALGPHLQANEATIDGRSQAALFGSNEMANRVATVTSSIAQDGH